MAINIAFAAANPPIIAVVDNVAADMSVVGMVLVSAASLVDCLTSDSPLWSTGESDTPCGRETELPAIMNVVGNGEALNVVGNGEVLNVVENGEAVNVMGNGEVVRERDATVKADYIQLRFNSDTMNTT